MTLKSICQNALREITGFEVPDSFIGFPERDRPIACVNLVQREGKRLAKKFDWNELIAEAIITTVSGDATYDKPSDFKHFANMSQWDRTNFRRLGGPYDTGTMAVPAVVCCRHIRDHNTVVHGARDNDQHLSHTGR